MYPANLVQFSEELLEMDKETRKQILSEIVKQIINGTYDSSTIPFERLMQPHTGARNEYIAPWERDSLNYDYTDVGQIGAIEEK
jgi:hypothetical protein